MVCLFMWTGPLPSKIPNCAPAIYIRPFTLFTSVYITHPVSAKKFSSSDGTTNNNVKLALGRVQGNCGNINSIS